VEGQCCWCENQCCCLANRLCTNVCAPNPTDEQPDNLGIGLLGYQMKPNSGCCKNIELGGDGTSYKPVTSSGTSEEGGAPGVVEMSRSEV